MTVPRISENGRVLVTRDGDTMYFEYQNFEMGDGDVLTMWPWDDSGWRFEVTRSDGFVEVLEVIDD